MNEQQSPDHERLEENLPAYALGALPDHETFELERHLETCVSCRSRAQWLGPAVDLLPAAVPQQTPPPGLRERLMAEVRAEADAEQGSAPLRRTAREPWWRRLRMPAPVAALAVTVLLIAGAVAGYLVRGTGAAEPETAVVPARALNGTEVSATLARHDGVAVLHVNAIPPIGPRKVYEVWIQRSGVMEPSSLFVLSSDGTADAAVPGPLDGSDAVYVTVEPRGGSPEPTSAPILQAPL